MSLTRQLRRSSQTLLLVVAPHGGQATARRNAWAGMSGDAAHGTDRRPAAPISVPEQPTRSGSTSA